LIRWITQNLGTSSYYNTKENPDIHIVDIRDLVDKLGNPPNYVKTKIEEALRYIQEGNKVVISCDYGISRSNAIAAGVLSLQEGISLNDAVRKVIKETSEKSIKIEVLSAVRKALGGPKEKYYVTRDDQMLVGLSSKSALELLITQIGYSYEFYDWFNQGIDNWDELDDYKKGERVTLTANRL